MDDFVLSNLYESKNEWCGRLVSILTPLIVEGVQSIFNESWKMCVENNEMGKYLMTFQNLLTRVPKWNSLILEEERKRIIEKSGCTYLEDLISCVHIVQLKVLTCIRVGNKQKKIDISIPKLDHFIHRVYVNVARKIYSNVYLFEKNVGDLQIQKYRRETEVIVQECILSSIRESIPTEAIIRAYMDETVEEEEEIFIEPIVEKPDPAAIEEKKTGVTEEMKIKVEEPLPPVLSIQNVDEEKVTTKLTFNNTDQASDGTSIVASKDIDHLEELSVARNAQRKLEEENDFEDLPDRIKIHTDPVILNDVFDLDNHKEPEINLGIEDL
uniref:Uncharacterized protein n=1 Tax=viral metagenome TaxID=1070528 RepID=A0A6C0HIN8_9ZZZZ